MKYIYLLILVILLPMMSIYGQYTLNFETCTNCNNATITNTYQGSMPLPISGYCTYGDVEGMQNSEVVSDFGRRGGNSRWHKGVDVNRGNNATSGDHVLAIQGGTVVGVKNFGNTGLKTIIIEGEGVDGQIFGYTHLFFDNTLVNAATNEREFPEEGMRSGDMIMKLLDGSTEDFAIIYVPIDADDPTNIIAPIAYSDVEGSTVTHPDVNGGLPLATTNVVVANAPIGAIGNSGGNFQTHLHLYLFTEADIGNDDLFNGYIDYTNTLFRTCKDPLQFLEYGEPNYDVSINPDNLTYADGDYSSIYVRCEMEGEISGNVYQNAVMDIDDVELYIKKDYEDAESYELIIRCMVGK